jgi:hypothetical protein
VRRLVTVGCGVITAAAGWFLATLLTAGVAGAAIIGVSGAVVQIAPPPSVQFDQLQSNTQGFAFDEQQCVTLAVNVNVNITEPGTYADDPNAYTPGTIPAGTVVSSQLVHFDPVSDGGDFLSYQGSVTTDQDILGIIVFGTTLSETDFLGAPGTLYPTGQPERGFEPFVDTQADVIIEQVDMRTVTIDFRTKKHVDQVRIITGCPPEQVAPDVTSEVHNQAHQDITNQTVPAGTVVHDKAIVTGSGPVPTGTVDFIRYPNANCSGSVISVESKTLGPDGTVESSDFTTVAGGMSYLVSYQGDDNYLPGWGPCEPLNVEQVGGEGCTPGYWKQKQHFDSWVGYSPTQTFTSAFGRAAFGNKKLKDVLGFGDGGLKALGRQAVAALLNATSPGVDYQYTSTQVISMFQQAFDSGNATLIESTKNLFDQANNRGCDLN